MEGSNVKSLIRPTRRIQGELKADGVGETILVSPLQPTQCLEVTIDLIASKEKSWFFRKYRIRIKTQPINLHMSGQAMRRQIPIPSKRVSLTTVVDRVSKR